MPRWHYVAAQNEFVENKPKRVDMGEQTVLVFLIDGDFFAIENKCTHQQKPLDTGTVCAHEIACPFHGARFDIKSGQTLGPPAFENLKTFETKVENEKVYVRGP